MIEADTPSLWDIRANLGQDPAVAILVNAFIHTAKLVNIDKNLTIEQIGEAAKDVLAQYGYLKVEEVKYLLKRALRTESLFGRLDYNVLMNWFEQYDKERTEEAIRVSEQAELQARNQTTQPAENSLSMAEYIEQLKQRAATDEDATNLLATFSGMTSQRAAISKEEQDAKDHEFKKWKTFVYQMNKK